MILAMFKEAWISILSNKLRSFLTILGVVIGVCAVVLMVATGQAVQLEIDKQLEGIGGNMMLVVPASSNRGGVHSGRGGRPSLTMQDSEAVKELKNVVNVAPLVTSKYQVVAGGNNWNTTVNGTNPDYLEINDYQIERGIMFTERDVYAGTPFAVIGQTIVDKLFPYGEEPLGQDIRIKGVPFKIIGILKEKGADAKGSDQDDIILLPVKAFKSRLTSNRFPDRVAILFLTFNRIDTTKLVFEQIKQVKPNKIYLASDGARDKIDKNIDKTHQNKYTVFHHRKGKTMEFESIENELFMAIDRGDMSAVTHYLKQNPDFAKKQSNGQYNAPQKPRGSLQFAIIAILSSILSAIFGFVGANFIQSPLIGFACMGISLIFAVYSVASIIATGIRMAE